MMLAGDLEELEREVATFNTRIFEETGASYQQRGIEDEMFSSSMLDGWTQPRSDLGRPVEAWFPDEVSRINRLMSERRHLLCKLMDRSLEWHQDLGDIAGGVSYLTSINPEFVGRAGVTLEEARIRGETSTQRIGQPHDPRLWINKDPFAFPDPIFGSAMFSVDVDPREVRSTRDYRDIYPWLLDDVGEFLVAQWVYEHTGTPPWPGSMIAHDLAAGKLDEEGWPDYVHVIDAADATMNYRKVRFRMDADKRTHQLLIGGKA